jgi:hypothetical protein
MFERDHLDLLLKGRHKSLICGGLFYLFHQGGENQAKSANHKLNSNQ